MGDDESALQSYEAKAGRMLHEALTFDSTGAAAKQLDFTVQIDDDKDESLIRRIAYQVIKERANIDPVASISFKVGDEVCRLTPIYENDEDELPMRIRLKYGDQYRQYNHESDDWETALVLLLLANEKLRPSQ